MKEFSNAYIASQSLVCDGSIWPIMGFLQISHAATYMYIISQGKKMWFWLVYGVSMPLSTIFQLYRGSQFYWWRKPRYLEKTTVWFWSDWFSEQPVFIISGCNWDILYICVNGDKTSMCKRQNKDNL
jgi:hypothetical protein